MPLNKDSLGNTLMISTLLCLACATLVSGAAVILKPLQSANALEDRQRNILKVSGFTDDDIKEAGGVGKLFESRFEATVIDLDSGRVATEECAADLEAAGKTVADVVKDYNQIWCSKSKKSEVAAKLDKATDIAGIKYREKYSHVFTLKSDSGEVEAYVFPVRGYGLWSMMQGYLAVKPDLKTVQGLTFYEQGETPGLGGEVMNPRWKKKWEGKQIYQDGDVALAVIKGDQQDNQYGVDALSGATITSNGVTNMIEFWLGDQGFGPYITLQSGGQPKTKADNHSDHEHEEHETDNANANDASRSAELGANHG